MSVSHIGLYSTLKKLLTEIKTQTLVDKSTLRVKYVRIINNRPTVMM